MKQLKLKYFLFVVCVAGIVGTVSLWAQVSKKVVKSVAIELHNGDILLQSGASKQCKAVKEATKSTFSHCGIYFEDNGKGYVYEAVQPVRKTPLTEWIHQGLKNEYSVVRLKKADSLLTAGNIKKMKSVATNLIGKDYDIYFDWSDEQMYCSEYVWKIYKNALGVEICPTKKFKSFDLSSPIVKAIIAERYGKNIPLDEQVIAPSDLYQAPNVDIIKK
jgi:uncharacterized protein YycO